MKKILIDVRDDIYDTCVNEYHNGTPFLAETVIARGEVLDEMTNGEVLRMVLPNVEVRPNIENSMIDKDFVSYSLDGVARNIVEKTWWNAPYKKEVGE